MGLAAVFREDKVGDLEKRPGLLTPARGIRRANTRQHDQRGLASQQPAYEVEDAFAV